MSESEERMVRMIAAMLAWENTHAIWDLPGRGDEPTREQDFAMYRDELLKAARRAADTPSEPGR